MDAAENGGQSPAWSYERAATMGDWERTIALADSIERVENEIATTLRALAARDGGKVAARRLDLAREADRAAQAAADTRERLQREGRRWADHADMVALRQALHRAAELHAELARTENDIADILVHMASRNGSDLAESQQRLADAASAAALGARERARSLGRRLAASGAVTSDPDGTPPREPSMSGPEPEHQATPDPPVAGEQQAGTDPQRRADVAQQNVHQSTALVRQAGQHAEEALRRAASAHDRAADADERSAQAGIGNVAEHRRKAAYHRAAATADRQRAQELRSQAAAVAPAG